MDEARREDELLQSVALQNASTILAARQRAEAELQQAKSALQQKTEELARSLAMMTATLESTTDGILVTDGGRAVTGFNERFRSMWTIPPAVMETGRHDELIEFVSQQLRDPWQFRARIDAIYATAPTETIDVLELRDGRVFERLSRVQLLDDQVVGRVWSFRDVTARRASDEAHSRLAALVESSQDAIIAKTLEGRITSWNKGAERVFGYTAVEAIGQPITILIPEERLDEEKTILRKLRRGQRVETYETVRKRKDGTLIDVALTVSPIQDASGAILGASKIARDITERRQVEREREQLLAAERAARGEAQRISLLKDEFLANLSHELRTPLNAILGWSQLLARGHTKGNDLREGLETIGRNARVQAQLIEDLLDMSRIISGKIRLDVQQVDLAIVVQEALATVRPSADAKGIRLRHVIDPRIGPVSGDPNRLQQVVWNLLNNAVKFTAKGGSVEALLQRVNSHLEITVRDTGIGIKAEFLPHVFERFRQADATSARAHGGLGLGLAIVKQLVELHGGTVAAASAGEGQGATFSVQLPLAPVREGKREHPAAPTRPVTDCDGLDLTGIKVLVVDDEADAREVIRRVLEHCKAVVNTAAGAVEALALIKTYRPHVLVSDIGMPETDGYDLIRRLREAPASEGRDTPAIALTAFAGSEDRTRAMLAGYNTHIPKPIESHELIATVASLAGRMRGHER